MPSPRYQWRSLTNHERIEILRDRKLRGRPWHSPPRPASFGLGRFHLTAACYEHEPIIGVHRARLDVFAEELIGVLSGECVSIFAWCLLPNHYHALVEIKNLRAVTKALGRLHGRCSFRWNGEDERRGRTVFFRTADRAMRSASHFWATLNYIHHNPVHHGYVRRWIDWPWSSAEEYLEMVGRDEARRIWTEFPVLDYGNAWDGAEL